MPVNRQNSHRKSVIAFPMDWRLFALGFLLFCISIFAAQAAQAQTFTPIIVSSETDLTSLGPYTIIRPDPQETITEARIRQTQGGALSGKIANQDILYLGQDGTPHWLAFKVLNNGNADNWILDTGKRLDGRVGYLNDINVYEMPLAMPGASHRPDFYLREITSSKGSSFYKISMPANSQKLIILHVRPVAGMPTTLPLSLSSGSSFVDHIKLQSSLNAIYSLIVLGLALLFGAIGIARKSNIGKSFAAYYLFIAACFIFYEYLEGQRSIGLFKEITMVISFAYTCLIVWTTRTFCRTDMSGYSERHILHAILWLSGAAMFLSFFLPAGDGSLQISILYGMPISAIALVSLMSFAQAFTKKINGYAFFLNWVFAAIGILITALASRQSLPANAFTLNAMWFTVLPQAALMVAAYFQRHDNEVADQTIGHSDSEKLNLSKLKQTKDEADHSRLLKVIEKERQMLAELRLKETARMDEMLKAKEAADEANRAKSAFLAVVSHEIRTPMTGIMGMVRLLLDSNITKQQKDYVLTIQDSGDAMLALLNDILDFEKIQRGKMELENISFDLHRLIQGVVTLMSGHAEQKSITLNVQVGNDIPRFVKGDPTRLRQVLLNLMGNAIKFTAKGGVTLHVKNMDENGTSKGSVHTIYFAVQDSGIGIPAEAQAKLFTPFAQADSTISRKFGGTGLGLAISKGLVEAMGSTVNINSHEGEGSTFFFTLKMEKGLPITQEPARPVTAPVTSQKVEPKHILVVDDNAINQKVISNFLEQDKHSIVLSSSAEDALSKLEGQDFDMILMDIELPGMSGNEATRVIRELKNPIKSVVPIVAITGNVDSDDIKRYLADGMSGTIAKPIDADLLKSMVRDMAGKPHVQKVTKSEDDRAPQPKIEEPVIVPALEETVNLQFEDGENDYQPVPPPAPSQASERDSNVFNTNMLQSLKDAIGDDQLKQLLDELIVKTDEIIGAMDAAIKSQDLDALYARAHELKGMTGNFGLLEISGIAALTEEKAKARQIDGLGDLIGSLPDASLRARDALEAWSTAGA